jgi:hypothetical protein
MHRTEGTNFDTGNLFKDGPPGTDVEQNWLNAVQEELAGLVEGAGLTILVASTDTRDQLKKAVQILTGGIGAPSHGYRNLVIENNAGTPNSQVDIDADAVALEDTTGRARTVRSVNLTADITASGANGLDTGAEAGATWYYIWVIYNETTQTIASLLSASNTTPTMPSGYTFKALVGAIYNSAGSNFITLHQINNRAVSDNSTNFVTNGADAGYTVKSLAAFIPKGVSACVGNVSGTIGAGITASTYLASESTGVGEQLFQITASNSTNTIWAGFILAITEEQNLYYKIGAGLANGYITGWVW